MAPTTNEQALSGAAEPAQVTTNVEQPVQDTTAGVEKSPESADVAPEAQGSVAAEIAAEAPKEQPAAADNGGPEPPMTVAEKLVYGDKDIALVLACAENAHELNRSYCIALGDMSQAPWGESPEWQKDSAKNGVMFRMDNPDATPERMHESWMAQKEAEGWKHGPVKDAEKKEHPCMVPYDQLPTEQKVKDYLFQAAIDATIRDMKIFGSKLEGVPPGTELSREDMLKYFISSAKKGTERIHLERAQRASKNG